jgi:glycine amidinotransferase
MANVINCWNEWDPLKRVIVGRPEGTAVTAPEPAWQYHLPEGGYPIPDYGPFPQEMVDAANEQMDVFVAELEKRGVTVDRPTVHPSLLDGRAISTPDWTQLNSHNVNNVRDLFLCHGNYLIESAPTRRSRWYEYLNLRPLFEEYFREDPDLLWFSAPKPRLTDESYVDNYFYNFNNVWSDEEKKQRLYNWEFQLTEKEPLWDAADSMRFGKDIFHQCACTTNRSGMDWLKRMMGQLGIRVHHVLFDTPDDPSKPDNYFPWHLDVNLVPLRPGLAMYNPDWKPVTPELWKLFEINDWELIPAARPSARHEGTIHLLPGQYEGEGWISMNTFSIDPKTVVVEAQETAYCEQLDKLGFDVVPIAFEKVIPFGGAFHCVTLDVHRQGAMEDYFPKQLESY